MDEPRNQNPHTNRISTLLEALKEACKDLRSNPIPFLHKTDSRAAIEAVLELEAKAVPVFSANPGLHELSRLLRSLRALIEELEQFQGYGLRSLLYRQITNYQISQVARAAECQIQAYVDQLSIRDLVKTMTESADEEAKVKAMIGFEKRLSRGFDLDFQDLVLRAKVFNILEHLLCDPLSSKRVQERAAMAIGALVKFNKNVFVGLVLMGPTIKALISMASSCSIKVLSSLIRFIRSPLVDELLATGEIARIISLLHSEDQSVQLAALDCVLEIAYIGRNEVIEAMLKEDLIKRLMELQRMNGYECDEERSEVSVATESESNSETREKEDMEKSPFASCVTMFAIQLEVGEGLSEEEKREFKAEILRKVKETSQSDAEAATISAEVLWGSSP